MINFFWWNLYGGLAHLSKVVPVWSICCNNKVIALAQWFSNFLSLQTGFTAPKTAADPFILSTFFEYWEIRFGRFLARVPQTHQQEANFRLQPAANCRHQNKKKDQSTCNMTMSDDRCVAMLNHGSAGRKKLADFLDCILVCGPLKINSCTPRGVTDLRLRTTLAVLLYNSMTIKYDTD